MRKILYIALGAMVLMLTACRHLNELADGFRLTAVMEGDAQTKTTMSPVEGGKSSVLWSAKDKIGVYVDNGTSSVTYSLVDGAGTKSATFTGEGSGSSYLAVYPKSAFSSRSGNTIQLTLPGEQAYTKDSFADGTFPMLAVSQSTTLQFRNICSVIRIPLTGSQNVSRIVFRSNDPSIKVSGKGTVDYSNPDAPVLTMASNACDSLVMNTGGVQLDPDTPTEFFLIVPAQKYTAGFTVRIYADGKYMDKSYDADYTTLRSCFHTASSLPFTPTTGDNQYLTFTSEGTTTISLYNYDNAPVLFYSTDKTNWTQWDYSELTFTSTTPLYFYGDNPYGFSLSNDQCSAFIANGDSFSVSGNIMSLLSKESSMLYIPSWGCFNGLFSGCKLLKSAHDLHLPAIVLAPYCYDSMFSSCTALASAPALPATTLASYCYWGMFYNCKALVTAPALPATTLAPYCYHGMFNICTALATAPALPATTLAPYCYYNMFRGTCITIAPELPATKLADYCYSQMFYGCSSLNNAPELPATTLADNCYSYMFGGCGALNNAPELPATTLADNCYSNMFAGCGALNNAPELPATTLADHCYQSMFEGCSSLNNAPELPATTLADHCYDCMFSGCSSLSHIKAMFTTMPGSSYTHKWVSDVALNGIFVKNNNATWDEFGDNGIPLGWEVQDEDGNPISAAPNTSVLFTSASTYVPNFVLGDSSDNNPWQQEWPGYISEANNNYYGMLTTTTFYNYKANVIYWYPIYYLDWIIKTNEDKELRDNPNVTAFGSNNNQIAVAKTLSAYYYMSLTDILGPIVFSDAFKEKDIWSSKYDTQEQVYEGLDTMLKEAYTQFEEGGYLNASADILYGGDIAKWKKLNASIRMLLAIKMCDVDSTNGKARFAAAYADGGMTSNADNFMYTYSDPDSNWNRLYYWVSPDYFGASFNFVPNMFIVDQMKSFRDNRMFKYFDLEGYRGLRPVDRFPSDSYDSFYGVPFGLSSNQAVYSWKYICCSINSSLLGKFATIPVIPAARVLLTEAEAAFRGWINVNPQTLYEAGITASFEQWGAQGVDAYITSPAVAYDSNKGLEQIALQRWIASYMSDGVETWSDWRRLDIPKMPVGPGAFDQGNTHYPYRLGYYFNNSATYNNSNYLNAIHSLRGGVDDVNSRLWWDVEPNWEGVLSEQECTPPFQY